MHTNVNGIWDKHILFYVCIIVFYYILVKGEKYKKTCTT